MKILVLGGTVFVGRHLVMAARAAGHEVTLFNRGQQNPDLFPDIEKLHGDRTVPADLDRAFTNRTWDAVLDTCGYVPRVVRLSAERLAGKVGTYCFISAVSVYADGARPGLTETAPVGTLSDPTVENLTSETYGPLKALCEQVVENAFPCGHALVIRPGLIVGPHDPNERLTYWLHRLRDGGEILTPDRWEMPVQMIDGRDLAEWILRLIEQKTAGTFNAVGPDYPLTLGEVLEACQNAVQSEARMVRVPEAFLCEQNITGWRDLPLWMPASANRDGLRQIANTKAITHGLTFRSLQTTLQNTLAWAANGGLSLENDERDGMTREKEAEVLAAWAGN